MNDQFDKVNSRLDEIQQDIKEFTKITTKNTTDISWLQGGIKILFGLVISITLSILGVIIKAIL